MDGLGHHARCRSAARRPDVNREQIILLGAVAAGGDPAAVTAALDPRIAAVVPFNFGEASPEQGGGKSSWPKGMADPGWGSWESTRNLARQHRQSILSLDHLRVRCAAPLSVLVRDRLGCRGTAGLGALSEGLRILWRGGSSGRGTRLWRVPRAGECANIGPSQRQTMYPYFKRWFDIPAPVRSPMTAAPSRNCNGLTPAIASELKMRSIHDSPGSWPHAELQAVRRRFADDVACESPRVVQKRGRENWAISNPTGLRKRRRIGISHGGTQRWKVSRCEVEPGIIVPMLLSFV